MRAHGGRGWVGLGVGGSFDFIEGSLPYNIKDLEEVVVVIWLNINKNETI